MFKLFAFFALLAVAFAAPAPGPAPAPAPAPAPGLIAAPIYSTYAGAALPLASSGAAIVHSNSLVYPGSVPLAPVAYQQYPTYLF